MRKLSRLLWSLLLLGACQQKTPATEYVILQPDAGKQPDATKLDAALGPKRPDCNALAERACAAFERCSPLLMFYAFDNTAACSDQVATVCSALADDGRYLDEDACFSALDAPHCSGFHGARLPVTCTVAAGEARDGASCYSDSDCQSTYCDRKEDCGLCAPRRDVREACSDTAECLPGLACTELGCMPPTINDACDEVVSCGGDLICVDSRCVEPPAAGAACAAGQCNVFAGEECDPNTERCAAFEAGSVRECVDGATAGQDDRPICRYPELDKPCTIDDECGKLAFCEAGQCKVVTNRCR